MKLYIADLHLYHEDLIKKFDMRSFADVKQMNSYIIEKWNSKVKSGDQVYVLGDMFWKAEASQVNYVLNRLNGKIFLIRGNHDDKWLKIPGVDLSRFEWIKDYAEVNDHGTTVILSHYPMPSYNFQFVQNPDLTPRSWMLYGHVHNSTDEKLINQCIKLFRSETYVTKDGKTIGRQCNMVNCFCAFSDYTPLSLEEWINVDRKRRGL